jgi:hypothetical protein
MLFDMQESDKSMQDSETDSGVWSGTNLSIVFTVEWSLGRYPFIKK